MVNGPNFPQLQAYCFRKTKPKAKNQKPKTKTKHVETKEEIDKERNERRPFQNSGLPCLHCISASPGNFRNMSVRFPRCLSMSAQSSCLMTVQKLSPLPYVSALGTVTLGLSTFVTSWLHWESCEHLPTKYWQELMGGIGWGDCVIFWAPIARVDSHRHWNQTTEAVTDLFLGFAPPRQRHLILRTAPELP